jgi:16S rRNA (cytosine967-C5)-methyltransferase
VAPDRRRAHRAVERPIRSARALALRVLLRVAEDGAYASRALDAELTRAGLDARDAALATEIVYGTLRVLPELDRRIAAFLRRDASMLDGVVRAALRAGCYQLDHLSRLPVHAIVDESVTAVREQRGRELAGLTNAVLRKLAAGAEVARAQASPGLVVADWLYGALGDDLGDARRSALLAGGGHAPPLPLRVRAGLDREAVAARLRATREAAEVELGKVSARALLARRLGNPRALPGYAEGEFAVQDEGAQAVALLLGARPGEKVADVCAGHGGKTALLAEQVGAQGEVVAIDLDERKLERIPGELARMQLASHRVTCQAIDFSVGSGGLEARFDRVLVDAPCTGLGTIRRRPELLLRVTPEDAARMAALQRAIVHNAVRLLRPGGVLLFAVCSPTRAEGVDLAARIGREIPALAPDLAGLHETGVPAGADADGVLRLGPWLSGEGADSPDVFQVMRWRLRPNA